MATLQGKAVKNTYRQVLQIGANNVGVSSTAQRVQDGAGVNTALSLSTIAATIHGDLTITGDLIITGGGIQIQDLIDDTVASLIQNGTGITWTYNDGARTLTGNFTGTTSVVAEGSNLYYTQARFDSAFAAKSTTNLTEGANLYFTTARGDANFATNFATKTTTNLPEGSNLYFTNARARTALSVTGGTGIAYDNATGVFNLAAIPNASLANSSITINGQSVSLGGTVTLTTTNIAEGTNLYWTEARGNSNFTTNLAASSTTNLAEGTNLYYTQARFDTAFSNKSTTNLAEGTNLYYTQARFNSALAAKTTTDLAEGTNLYYTDARARLALSSSATGLSYANNSGVFSLTAGYAIPTTVKLGQYDTAYNRSIVSAAVTGTATKTLSLTQQDANVITATWTDQGITTINGTANQITATTVANTTTLAFTNDVTMPNNLVVSGNLTINGTATYVNTQSISAKDPLFEVANDNNTTDAVDIGYYGRYYDTPQTRVEFTGLFRDASDAGKFKFFTGLVDEPTNVVNTTGTGYTVGTLVANFEGNLAGTANAANVLSTARTIAASGDATWSVSFDGSANVTSALTLANTGVTATTYGTSTAVPTIAIDGKGRITSASNTNIAFPVTTVNGFAGTVVLTTTNIAEGTNQYFTSGRAQSAITISTTGTSGAATYTSGNINVPIYIGGSGSINQIAYFDTTGTISSLTTATYPSLTELSYVKGVTSAIQAQINTKAADNAVVHLAGAETITGAKTFSDTIVATQIKAATSAGLSINANSGTQVADFGAGGSANITFFGGLSGTSATFSGNLTIDTNTLFVDSVNNNVGIGTTSNIYGKLSVEAAGNHITMRAPAATAGKYWALDVTSANQFYVINNAGTKYFTMTDAGNFGISTASPSYTLDVLSTQANTFRLLQNLNGEHYININNTSTGTSATSRMDIGVNSGSYALTVQRFGLNYIGTLFGVSCTNSSAIYDNAASSNGLFIGAVTSTPIIFGTNNAERMRIAANGVATFNQTINSSAQLNQLNGGVIQINNETNSNNWYMRVLSSYNNNFRFNYNGVDKSEILNSTGVFIALSDINKKKDFELSTLGLDAILGLKSTLYRIIEEENSEKHLGFIAQEVKEFIPQAYVESGEEGSKFIGLDYQAITATLVKAVQELEARIKELEAK